MSETFQISQFPRQLAASEKRMPRPEEFEPFQKRLDAKKYEDRGDLITPTICARSKEHMDPAGSSILRTRNSILMKASCGLD